ncbi:coiled-coil domain-containing protein 93 isoform X2 [Telopea speciosissima]|uniref:coiled-coil domain-containing protein 93 isoform X2 n=1 Tax=Telopea speciosissima TaxID=54955 RepID=UPI001CC7155B|nr:coiled-coil domain-containing protein 93 isoform X2 [Telopea speciosissima]
MASPGVSSSPRPYHLNSKYSPTKTSLVNAKCNKSTQVIEAALKSMGCPYPLRAHQIRSLDYKAILPVVQWIVSLVLEMPSESADEVTHVNNIEEEEYIIRQLEKELSLADNSVTILQANLKEQNQKKANVLNEMQHLREKIDKEGASNTVQTLTPLFELSKDLQRQEQDLRSYYDTKRSDLQAEVSELEEKISSSNQGNNLSDDFEHSLRDSLERLNSAKSELAAQLRTNLLLKRKIEDVPSQAELIQYEHRFSELYVQIQDKLRQTRKFYATYNAILEIKELMLKETSLLNSMSSQFQDAITSAAGRMKLIESMEGILKGTKQKLEKVQLGFTAEQKICDCIKEKYFGAIAEQRRCSFLLKAFQEECAKNDKLRNQISN